MSRFNNKEGLYELLVKRVEEINIELDQKIERIYSHLDLKSEENQRAIRKEINGLRGEIQSLIVSIGKYDNYHNDLKKVESELEELEQRHYILSSKFHQSFGRGSILTALITGIVVSAFTFILTQYSPDKETSDLLLKIHIAQIKTPRC